MSASFSFKPGLVATTAAIIGILIAALLGDWQLHRAAHKSELQARLVEASRSPALAIGRDAIDPAAMAYHPVQVRGHLDADRTVYIDNRVHQGIVGYVVVSPLQISGSDRYVLVERGWVAAGPDRTRLPAVAAPPGDVDIHGIALPGNPRLFELSHDVLAGKVWQNLTVDRYRERFGIELQPVIVQQHNEMPDGLVRDWAPPSLGIERHRAYAFQWFSLAVVILILYVTLNVRRNKVPA